jgi:hypothetical protein
MSERAAGLASGTRGTAREVARAWMRSAPTSRPHWAASERKRRARGRGLAPTGGDHLSDGGAHARGA